MAANPEAYNYQGDDVIVQWTTWTPDVVKVPQEKPSDEEILPSEGDTTIQEVMSKEDANKMVEDFLKDPETSSALANLRVIEEKFKTGSLPENINNCYKKAKEQAILKLQGDKNFQLALEQAWVKIDGFEKNLQEYSEDEAANEVKRILGNPATQEQLKLSRNVIIENCDKLDPKQRESLEEGLKIFKDSIRKASQEIWID